MVYRGNPFCKCASKAHGCAITKHPTVFRPSNEIPGISGNNLLEVGSRTVPPGMMMTASRKCQDIRIEPKLGYTHQSFDRKVQPARQHRHTDRNQTTHQRLQGPINRDPPYHAASTALLSYQTSMHNACTTTVTTDLTTGAECSVEARQRSTWKG